jgi:hypothetical protein
MRYAETWGVGDEQGWGRLPGQTGQVYTPVPSLSRSKEEIGTKTGLVPVCPGVPLRQICIAPGATTALKYRRSGIKPTPNPYKHTLGKGRPRHEG